MTRAERARLLWPGGWVRCPTDGRILPVLEGDDKVLCGCGRSNPAVPVEATERTGVHVVRFLRAATADEWLAQEDAEAASC